MVKASIIIPTKNGGLLFGQVLERVLSQEAPWPFEVVVVDSGSNDGTVELCRRDPHVTLHTIEPHEFGHGRTRNLGISLSQGEFVVLITQDALPANEHWLRELVEAVDQAPDVAGAFGRHRAYPGASPFTARDLDGHFDGFLQWPAVMRMKDDAERYRNDPGYRQVMHFLSNNNSCLRRSVWENHPFPDVDFAEDQIWTQGVIEAGYGKAYADRAVVYHSHDFGPWEQGRRSFDESYALRHLFGYALCPSPVHMLAQSLRTTLADWHYAQRQGALLRWLPWVLRSPFWNGFRQLGFYIGQRADRLPGWFVERYSRDRSLRNRS